MNNCLMLHIVTIRQCVIQVEGIPAKPIQPGHLTLVPHGQGHVVASAAGLSAANLFETPREQLSERYEVLRLGGGGERTTMLCGVFQFNDAGAERLVALLPEIISLDTWADSQTEWLPSTLRMITSEAKEMNSDGEAVITRLADILVIQAIRHWITNCAPAETGWLGALRDRQIGPVVAKVNRYPTRRWTLDALAAEASRSAFAARFSEIVGEPAMRYVTRHQMNTAQARLLDGGMAVAELAHSFGYESEAAFNRTFKRHIGVTPGAVRRARTGARSS